MSVKKELCQGKDQPSMDQCYLRCLRVHGEKNHLSASKSWDIFIFTLSWRPFVQFLDMFCKYNGEFKLVFIGIATKCNPEVTKGIMAPHSLNNIQH